MRYLTFISLGASLISGLVDAHEVQPDFVHSIPDVLTEGAPIQNWNLQGSTKVFSDRLTLTDLGKANQAGSAWSAVANDFDKWTIDVDFSVAGPVEAGGGLALWYTNRAGELGNVHGSKDKWDGLGILIDSVNEGTESDAGTVRAYLNDGSYEYSSLPKPAEKAFASCQLDYRNTGYYSQLKVSYQDGFFRIKVNGQLCFQTDHIVLQKGGYFGITAQNTDNADSFILHRVQVFSDVVPPIDEGTSEKDKKPQEEVVKQNNQQETQQQQNVLKDQKTDSGSDDLQAILQKLNSLADAHTNAAQDAGSSASNNNEAISEIKNDIRSLEQAHSNAQASIEKKISSLENVIKDLIEMQRRNIEHGVTLNSNGKSEKARLDSEMKKLHNRLEDINSAVKQHTESLIGSIPETVSEAISKGGPSIWMVFTLLIFIQGGVFVGYLIYKTRRSSYHAKML